MKKSKPDFTVFLVLCFAFLNTEAQDNTTGDLYSYRNSFLYAEYLMKTKQYDLAIPELERAFFLNTDNDSIRDFLIKAYRQSGKFEQGIYRIKQLFPGDSLLSRPIARDYAAMLIKTGNFQEAYSLAKTNTNLSNEEKFFILLNTNIFSMKIDSARYIYENEKPELKTQFPEYKNLLEQAAKMKYKSPAYAGLMSAVFPGSGKVYTKNIKDAIIAFVIVGASSFQAYRGFSKNGVQSGYGWIYGAFAFGFYTGNIYGSYKAAQKYNAALHSQMHRQAELLFDSAQNE